MSKMIDLTNQRFGKLVAIKPQPKDKAIKDRSVKWLCKCDCGNFVIVSGSNLRSGHTQSCGCLQKEKASQTRVINEIGNKYGKLLVIQEGKGYTSPSGSNRKTWICQCDCGNTIEVVGTSLRKGLTKSCGCLLKEAIPQHWEEKILNTKYPNLKVLKRIETTKTMSKWLCQCNFCGNTYILPTSRLSTSQGCGCQTLSAGSRKIQQLLDDNNIAYITEKTFDNCIFPKTKHKARFDFYIENKYLIEFDGIQHFEARGGWSSEENLKKTQERDNFKNQWCKDNNISLIRIPYWQEKDLKIEDLLLDTTNFLYKGDNND